MIFLLERGLVRDNEAARVADSNGPSRSRFASPDYPLILPTFPNCICLHHPFAFFSLMSLLSLSGDALSEILGWLEVPSLSRVFLLGSRALYSKIVGTKALTHVKATTFNHQQAEKPLKRQTTFAGLQRLSQIAFLAQFTCIRHLVLDFSGHPVICDQVDAILFLPLVTLVLKVTGAALLLYDPSTRQIRHLDHHLPSLTTLEWMETTNLDPRLFKDDALEQIGRHLPSTLTRLQMGVFWRPPHALMKHLPPSLSDVSISCSESVWDKTNRVGTHVKKLELMVGSSRSELAEKFVFALPSDLLSLSILPIPGKSPSSLSVFIRLQETSILPHHLTSLRIPFERSLTSAHLQCLPASLTELHAGQATSVADAGIEVLPRGLRHLEIGAHSATSHAFSLLPPCLTVLKCGFSVANSELNALKNMPRSITHFEHAGAERYDNISLSALLPPSLHILRAPFTPIGLQDLPSSLKSLKVSLDINFTSSQWIPLLPDGLETLVFSGFVVAPHIWETPPLILPSSLTHLHVSAGPFINSTNCAQLPRTLTYLYTGFNLTTESLPLLPPSLTEFYAEIIIIMGNVTQKLVDEYRALTSPADQASSTTHSSASPRPFFGSNLFRSSNDAELHLHADDFFNMAKSLIPKSITTVPCLIFSLPITPALLSPLPPNLATLDLSLTDTHFADPVLSWLIGNPSRAIEAAYDDVDLANQLCGFHRSHASHLQNLKTLIMRPPMGDRRFKSDGLMFGLDDAGALPASLTHLEIDWNLKSGHIAIREEQLQEHLRDARAVVQETVFRPLVYNDDCSWLKRLPLLVHLTMTWNTEFAKYLPHLPTGLLTLQCQHATLNSADFAHLPPQLTHLSAQYCNFKAHSAFAKLPPLLKRFRVGDLELSGPCTSLLLSTSTNNVLSTLYSQWKLYIESIEKQPLPAELKDIDFAALPVTEAIFSRLPAGVTRISLPDNHNITTASIPQWPPRLTSMHLGSLLFGDSDLKDLPQDLDVLDWTALLSVIKQRLPPSLTELQVEVHGAARTGTDLSLVPQSVKTIQLDGRQGSWCLDFASLPRSLETCRFPSARYSQISSVQHIPTTMKELSIFSLPLLDSHIPSLPATLTHLDLHQTTTLTEACFKLLPRQLIHLNLASCKASDVLLSTLPPALKFLRLGLITITGTHTSALETVSLFTLISAVQDAMPSNIENQAILEWELEVPTILDKINPDITRHIVMPAQTVEHANSLTEMEPGVAYLCSSASYTLQPPSSMAPIASRPSLAPHTKVKPAAAVMDRILRYQLIDPSPRISISNKSSSVPLTVFWNVPSLNNFNSGKLPADLLTFTCHHLRVNPGALPSFPHALSTLRIPHVTFIAEDLLLSLPKTLTDLEIKFEDFICTKDKLADSSRTSIIAKMPPSLHRLAMGTIVYVGTSTMELVRD